jgi:hypothetical protein
MNLKQHPPLGLRYLMEDVSLPNSPFVSANAFILRELIFVLRESERTDSKVPALENLIVFLTQAKSKLQSSGPLTAAFADKLAKAALRKIFLMAFGEAWIPAHTKTDKSGKKQPLGLEFKKVITLSHCE